MDRDHRHLFGFRIGLENTEIRDQPRRALRFHAKIFAMLAAFAMTERRDEIELVHKAALALRHDDENLAAGIGDLRRAAAAGQPHLRLVIGADHGRVEIGIFIDLCTAEKTDGDAPALQPVAEHFRHRHRGERGVAEFAVTDRERQYGGLGGNGSGFIDQGNARRMREAGHIRRRRRHADADKTDVFVAQRTRRGNRHDLVRLVVQGHAGHSAAIRSARTCEANTSGVCPSTFSFIQARKLSRSREMPSHSL